MQKSVQLFKTNILQLWFEENWCFALLLESLKLTGSMRTVRLEKIQLLYTDVRKSSKHLYFEKGVTIK